MPSRCIFFFSALRAWSTLLSRTRTCTHPPHQCAQLSALGEWNGGASVHTCATLTRSLADMPDQVHKPRRSGAGAASSASVGRNPRYLPHLAAGAHRRLAVKMHGGAGNGEPGTIILDLAADEVDHFHAARADRLGT